MRDGFAARLDSLPHADVTRGELAIDKQKTLLSADVGHFSLVRAMHLADLITLMNGMSSHWGTPSPGSDPVAMRGVFTDERPG